MVRLYMRPAREICGALGAMGSEMRGMGVWVRLTGTVVVAMLRSVLKCVLGIRALVM